MMEPTKDELHALLVSIVAHSNLEDLPEGTQQRLNDAVVTTFDESHVAHSQALSRIVDDLKYPRHAPDFFAKYDLVLPIIAAHDGLATDFIIYVLLWREGKLATETLKKLTDIYRDTVRGLMLP